MEVLRLYYIFRENIFDKDVVYWYSNKRELGLINEIRVRINIRF